MRKIPAAIVFDMDGVLLDTEPIYKRAWQSAAAELHYDLDDESYLKVVGRPNDDGERELVSKFGADFPLARFRARWPQLWRAEVETGGIQQKPGVSEVLAFAAAHDLAVGVATSSDANFTAFSLRRAALDNRFSIVVTGDQVASGKPAPDIYLEAARRLGVEPTRCVAVEDSEAGIIAASRAGMIAVLIPDWARPSELATKTASRVLASLHEARELIAELVTR